MNDRSFSLSRCEGQGQTTLRWRVLSGALVLLLAGLSCELPFITTSEAPPSPAVPPVAASTQPPTEPAQSTETLPAVTQTLPTETLSPAQPTVPQPTVTPAPVPISKDGLSGVSSSDVIRELTLFVGGAGAGEPPCNEQYPRPGFILPISMIEKMGEISLTTCGWQDGEPVQITVTDPNGTLRDLGVQKSVIDPNKQDISSGVTFQFRTWPEDPAGIYIFTLQGTSGAAQAMVEITAPVGPRIYLLTPEEYASYTKKSTQTPTVLLFGFAPGEKLELLVYRGTLSSTDQIPVYNLLGQSRLEAGSDGKLLIPTELVATGLEAQTGLPDYLFAAIGEQSGVVHQYSIRPHGFPQDLFASRDVTCPGGGQALFAFTYSNLPSLRVITPEGQLLPLTQNPGWGSPVVVTETNGVLLTVMEAPRCNDGVWWWPVSEKDGNYLGYAPEKVNGQYVLEVVRP